MHFPMRESGWGRSLDSPIGVQTGFHSGLAYEEGSLKSTWTLREEIKLGRPLDSSMGEEKSGRESLWTLGVSP